MKRIVIGIFSAIVLFILFVVLCTFVRKPYEEVLLDRFGSLIPEGQQARIMYNWYFKLPFDSVIRIDTRLHLKTLPLKEFVTAGRNPVNVRTFAVWRIVDPVAFRQKASGSDDVAEQIMEQRLLGLIGQELGEHQLDEFFSTNPDTDKKVSAIETGIAQQATNGSKDGKTPGLREIGIEIADIGFSRMAFPPSNTEAVFNRMVSDLKTQASTYENEGLQQAEINRTNGILKATETRSDAIAEAQKIRGEGDREALEILAKVNNTDAAREFYQYYKSLDFLKTALAKNTVLVLSTDNPILKALFQAPQTSTTRPGVGAPPAMSDTPSLNQPSSPAPTK
jgi:modulator of FtsH protease HflC